METKIRQSHPKSARVASPLCSLALALCCCAFASAQISPGRLSRAHQALEGASKCTSCHRFGAVASGFKCLECHAEIQRRVAAQAGFHAKAYRKTADELDCTRCHKEHKGRSYGLVSLDRRSFDHLVQTGFALEGKHRVQNCERCHTAKHVAASSFPEIKLKDVNRSFLGLGRECLSCHADQHRGQLGSECARCHVQEAWKPAPGFDHRRAAFVLTGLHQQVPCHKCHQPRPGDETVQFKGVAFSACQNCHADPHHGAFQELQARGPCESCHNTNGWKDNRPGAGFNHNITKFRLSGKHADMACSKCHKGSDFRRPMAHERCRDCHEDPHRGQFASRAAGSDCSGCHDETHFKPSRFDKQAHRRSAFSLEGKHAQLACSRCHQPEGSGAVYITGKLTCPACHADQHAGEVALAPYSNKCDLCHTQDGFKRTTFSAARHAETRFALTGKHATVECDRCHKPLKPGSAATPAATAGNVMVTASGPPSQYHFASLTCNACHDDPHQTQVSCEQCHTPQQWKELRQFDHSRTKFGIEGAHEQVRCIDCHKPSKAGVTATGEPAPGFGKTPNQCAGCHAAKDAHGAQFSSGARVEDCSSCHTSARWELGDFAHDNTRFALDAAHRRVDCAKCHKDQREVNGKLVRIYRETPQDCIQCHP